MKFTPEELAHIEVLIAKTELAATPIGATEPVKRNIPSSYAELIARRRARLRKARG